MTQILLASLSLLLRERSHEKLGNTKALLTWHLLVNSWQTALLPITQPLSSTKALTTFQLLSSLQLKPSMYQRSDTTTRRRQTLIQSKLGQSTYGPSTTIQIYLQAILRNTLTTYQRLFSNQSTIQFCGLGCLIEQPYSGLRNYRNQSTRHRDFRGGIYSQRRLQTTTNGQRQRELRRGKLHRIRESPFRRQSMMLQSPQRGSSDQLDRLERREIGPQSSQSCHPLQPYKAQLSQSLRRHQHFASASTYRQKLT